LGCNGYPNCRFTYDYKKENNEKLKCPKCEKELNVKAGQYGTFLGCSGYPDCDYTFNLERNKKLEM